MKRKEKNTARSSHLVKTRMLFGNRGFTHYTAFFRISPLMCLWFLHSERSLKYLSAFQASGVDSVIQKPVVQVYTGVVCVCSSVNLYYIAQMFIHASAWILCCAIVGRHVRKAFYWLTNLMATLMNLKKGYINA
jgi:hypothetical protein